jgi:hypothetical protein
MHWAKYYSFLDELPQYLVESLGSNLEDFKRIVSEEGWDPHHLLPNKQQRKIFVD